MKAARKTLVKLTQGYNMTGVENVNLNEKSLAAIAAIHVYGSVG